MSIAIAYNSTNANIIDISDIKYKSNTNYCVADVITDEREFISHAADAIRSKQKINMVISEAYKNDDLCKATRFIFGINTGFRDSDIRNIRVKDIINPDGTIKDWYAVNEIKTQHTRKCARGRRVYLNETVKKAIGFLITVRNKSVDDYLFTADKCLHKCKYIDPLTQKKFDTPYLPDGTKLVQAYMETSDYSKFLKKMTKSLGMSEHCSSHCQRQTYGYWIRHTTSQWEKDNDYYFDDKDIELLSNDFGHSSISLTAEHYNRHDPRVEMYRQLEINLGYEAVNEAILKYKKMCERMNKR